MFAVHVRARTYQERFGKDAASVFHKRITGSSHLLGLGAGKSALPPSPPKRELLRAIRSTQLRGSFDEQPKQDGSVVVRQFDQFGLGDQAAKLDELPGAFASFHLPLSRVMPCSCCQCAAAKHFCPARLKLDFQQLGSKPVPILEGSLRQACASPPAQRRPSPLLRRSARPPVFRESARQHGWRSPAHPAAGPCGFSAGSHDR